jgi:zeaxanthin glucosyltransferase
MSTIVMFVWPLQGAMTPCITLGRRLKKRGHRIVAVGPPDAEAVVRAAGLEFRVILAGIFPEGLLLARRQLFASLRGLSLLREVWRVFRGYRALVDDLVTGGNQEIGRLLDQIDPDLVLVNSDIGFHSLFGLLACQRGFRFAYLTTVFRHHADPAVPPLSSGLVPQPSFASRMRIAVAWELFLTGSRIRQTLLSGLGLEIDVPGGMSRLIAKIGPGAPALVRRSFLGPLLDVEEFFICPEELDFPVSSDSRRHWVGLSVDLARPGGVFPWDRIDPSRKLLYCSLGTLLFLPLDRQRAFLQSVIDAVAACPEWQLVMATGAYVDPAELRFGGSDAVVMNRIPQLEILRRATLMISHAGANTVQECAYFGVPMLVFPIAFDQQGCAARVLYHRFGLRGDIRRAGTPRIGRMIDAAAADPELSTRARDIARRLQQCDLDDSGLRALETLALVKERNLCAA